MKMAESNSAEKDFYLDEQEVALSTNVIVGLINYLGISLERYKMLLSKIVEEEIIKDEKICSQLNSIVYDVDSYEVELLKLGEDFQKNIIAKELCAVEEKNIFHFPAEPDLTNIPMLEHVY